jgi:hypothetical protein
MERIFTLDTLNLRCKIIYEIELLSFDLIINCYILFTVFAELIISLYHRTFETHIVFIAYFHLNIFKNTIIVFLKNQNVFSATILTIKTLIALPVSIIF